MAEPTSEPGAVALFVTCVGEMVEPDVPVAVVRVLRRHGCDVTVPPGQTCCGQPAWNAGFAAEAVRVARASLQALEAEPGRTVVVPAGSCATMIRKYWVQLFELAGEPGEAARAAAVADRVQEFSEYLVARRAEMDAVPADPPPADHPSEGAPAGAAVALHASCHLLRELGVESQPRDLVESAAGCAVADWSTADVCCGFGGTFSVNLPETSVAMADEKLDTLPAGVTEIVGTDASCLLQLRTRAEARGLPVTTTHVAVLLEHRPPPRPGRYQA